MARQFSPVLEIDSEMKSKPFMSSSSDSSHFSSSMLSMSMPSGILDKNSDRDPVPPSSVADIPTSMHSSFLTKSSKNRLSWAPEIPLSHTKTVAFEKEQRVKLDFSAGIPNCENHDVSPIDIPVRDSDYPSKRSDAKPTTAKSVATLGRLMIAPVQKSTTAVNASAGIAEEKSLAVSSSKIVRINRRVSPPRPQSVGPGDDHHEFTHRRFLPADPQATGEAMGEATRDQSTSQESGATTLLTFRPETVEASVSTSYAGGGTVTVSSRTGSAGNQSTSSSIGSQGKSGGATLGRSSPFKMLLSSEKDAKTTWVKKAQQMQQQWEQRHQRKGSDAREIDVAGKSHTDVVSEAEPHDEEIRRKKREERQSQKTSKFSPPENISLDTPVFDETQRIPTNRTDQRGSRPVEYSPYLRSRSMSSDVSMTTPPRPSFQANESVSLGKKPEAGRVPASATNNGSLEVLLHRQRHQQLINTNSDEDDDDDDDIPKEGEPDTMGTVDTILSRAPKSRIISINSNSIKAIAVSSDLHDETEKQCAQVASELTEAVTKARQMYTQLSNDSLYDGATNSHDRALKLLRETICEAKDQLTQAVDAAPAPSVIVQNLATDPRMIEMLDCYSQKLYDLFKQKLEND